jgi:hypothetical protein
MDSKELFTSLYAFENEDNPASGKIDKIYPNTTLEQVFDINSPSKKNLRVILDEMYREIRNGGHVSIRFPVTSVNGKTNDVMITKKDVHLENVDNTSDMEKPLSTIQRSTVMDILKNYNFQSTLNLDPIYHHMNDKVNPHQVTMDQINSNKEIDKLIEIYITKHNVSADSNTHFDIRRKLAKLWDMAETALKQMDIRIDKYSSEIYQHIKDPFAHDAIFNKKEDKVKKVSYFTTSHNYSHEQYPTTRAVCDFVELCLNEFNDAHPTVEDWIDDIQIVGSENELPLVSSMQYRKAFILKKGNNNRVSLAICRKLNDSYYWDIKSTGIISEFDSEFFINRDSSMTLNVNNIFRNGIDLHDLFDYIVNTEHNNPLKDLYYNYDHTVKELNIRTGRSDGTIEWYINNDFSTLISVPVAGLHRCAYLEWITENEIRENAIFNRHLVTNSVDSRVIAPGAIGIDELSQEVLDLIYNGPGTGGGGGGGGLIREIIQWDVNNAGNNVIVTGSLTNTPLELNIANNSNGDGFVLSAYTNESIAEWETIQTTPNSIIIRGSISRGTSGSGSSSGIRNSPHRWEPGVVMKFDDGSCGVRFIGKLSVRENQWIKVELQISPANRLEYPLTSGFNRLLEVGGSWCTDTERKAWSAIGGSNLTGHTYMDLELNNHGIVLDSISTGKRFEAFYDIWMTFLPFTEDHYLSYMDWYEDPSQKIIYEETPNAVIHFESGRLTGLINNVIYSINQIDYMTEASSIEIMPEWYGKTIEIVKKVSRLVGTGYISSVVYHDSVPQVLTIPARRDGSDILTKVTTEDPIPPNVHGRLIGLTSAMEFNALNDPRWRNAAYELGEDLPTGPWKVRYKATDTAFASTSVIFTIK